jgi:hypothetical protein
MQCEDGTGEIPNPRSEDKEEVEVVILLRFIFSVRSSYSR